ncbi:uncharacterized protein CHAB577_0192 [Chlamydia abortus]|nr:uncharacterized protein CHAB577_0192 [Chlamydia abortus]
MKSHSFLKSLPCKMFGGSGLRSNELILLKLPCFNVKKY